ncbi:general stress protein [Nocardia amikacinitolerans]|uniref:general stress protein n=1 Tax=Nocardia amikacinitolerans TaxID=756689 RepID=UPI0020A289FC|nr:KGG domain-containing protein [Nocardia amikacinitolerans]MCP2290753.1 Stress-induced acidophilic repeat motif-containing protein [Nocardia amikacinitolerans]
MADNQRGFAAMDSEQQRRIASLGGKASGGSFDNDPRRASEAGKKGAAAQSVEAKRLGGRHSHQGR